MSLLIKGITKLSELNIDADKDWGAYGISNIGTVIVTDGAGHYMELPSLTTAQRNALAPSTGMAIWNSDNTRVEKYDGSDWGAIGIAGVTVRKNTQMPVLGTRPQLNFIEGAAIGLNLADNPPDDEIDITISAKYPTRFKVLIPDDAAEAVPGGETKAALANVVGTNFGYESLDFDPAAEEVVYWEEYLTPDYLSENIVVDIYWITTDANAAHNAVFGISVLGRQKGDAWDAALGVERTVVSLNGGAGVLNKARITTFAPGWSPGDVLLFKLARKAADGSDDVDQDARVVKVVVSYTGQFAQAFYPLPEAVELTLTASGVWTDANVSAYIPAGATGVILHIENIHTSARFIGLRKKGSTDDRHDRMFEDSHLWAMCGVDESRKFQYYVEAFAHAKIWLVGYTATGVVFLDNAVEKVPAGFGAWQGIDVSAECPNAIGVIVELTGSNKNAAVRKNGSALDTPRRGAITGHIWAVAGVDGAQLLETYLSDVNTHLYIIGYVTEGAVFPLNGIDKAPSANGAWIETDCSGDAPSAIMLFFCCQQLSTPPLGQDYGFRKHGSTETILRGEADQKAYAFVPCDSGQKVDIYAAGNLLNYPGAWIMGYATWAGA